VLVILSNFKIVPDVLGSTVVEQQCVTRFLLSERIKKKPMKLAVEQSDKYDQSA
jgi:hypothetical protein